MSQTKFISKLSSLSESEIRDLLEKDFSSAELIEILKEVLELDPKIKTEYKLYDCCGTGGDKANTFNISTAAAIIASACGIKVCKNGGRSSSSKTGSVDALEELKVNLDLDFSHKLELLEKHSLSFHNSKIIAETLAPLKNYARKNKISSFLSLLGPFTNPFFLEAQIIGVGKKEWFEKVTALAKYSIKQGYCKKIILIQSIQDDGQVFDELTSITKAQLRFIDQKQAIDFDFNPKDYNLSFGSIDSISGGEDHKANAQILESVIFNEANLAKIETTLLNAALLIFLKNGEHKSEKIKFQIKENYNLAKSRLSSNAVKKNWQNFLDYNARYYI